MTDPRVEAALNVWLDARHIGLAPGDPAYEEARPQMAAALAAADAAGGGAKLADIIASRLSEWGKTKDGSTSMVCVWADETAWRDGLAALRRSPPPAPAGEQERMREALRAPMPGCMMPDGGEPCEGYTALYEAVQAALNKELSHGADDA